MTKNVQTNNLSEPLGSATTAKVDIHTGDGNLTIDRLTGGEQVLASGTLQYFESQGLPTRTLVSSNDQATLMLKGGGSRRPWFRFPWAACNGATEWQIHLNPTVSFDLTVHSGGGNLKLDLAGAGLTSLSADTGGGNIDILLPDTDSSMKVVARTGAGNVTIMLPDGIKARLYTSSGFGKIIMPSQFKKTGDKTYQCDGYEESACKVEIEATSGAGNVIVNTIGMMSERQGSGMTRAVSARGGGVRDWQRWVPYAAVAWSLIYAALGVYWAVSGRGFPYTPKTVSDIMGPLLGRFGPGVAWIVVMMAGIPAAAMGAAMLRGVRGRMLRPLFITAGALLAGVLLLFMADLTLLETLGYVPYAIVGLLTGAKIGQIYLETLAQYQWIIAHQLLCLIGGFLWLAATVCYARLSGNACLYCGRRNSSAGWNSPDNAARWSRIALYVAMVAPVFYALTRYAWALGFPLGMSEEYLRQGQERGMWTAGLFLANFGLVGAVLMLGLVQRWGEVFPRWMIGLAGRRVPIALAVVLASLVSVLLIVGGIAIWSGLAQMVANLAAGGAEDIEIIGAIIFQLGPTLLFPVWGVALAVATLGYYYRRRGPCRMCGRGALSQLTQQRAKSVV